MIFLLLLPAMLSFLLFAAHWLRPGNLFLVALSLLMIPLLWIPRPWMRRTVQVLLLIAALEWLRTTWDIAQSRMEAGDPWLRAAVILLAVTLFNLLAAFLLQLPRATRWYTRRNPGSRS